MVAGDGQGKNIHDLPDEIILDVFSFFSFNELIDILQNVCVRWKRLAHDPVLWCDKEYIVRGRAQNGRSCCGVTCSECAHCRCEKTDREVLRTAGMMPQLRTLTMMRGTRARILRKICRNCPNLTTLQLHGCQKMNYSLLKYIFEKCPKIEKLIIANNLLADRQYTELVSRLEHLQSLEVFENRRGVGPVLLRFLADTCSKLREINLSCDYHPLEDVEYFVKAKRDTLTSATVRWTMAGKRCVVPVLKEAASSLKKLQLRLFDVALEEEAATFADLGELHNLRELHCNQLCPHRPRLISLAFQPGCLPLLQKLDLPHATDLPDDAVVTISRGCPSLRHLSLTFATSLTDGALAEIHRLKHLQILDLSGCSGLGGSAVAHVAQLPALRTLLLQYIDDLTDLQPSLRHVLDLKQLRCLDILYSGHIRAVPFEEFSVRLVNLRELHVTYEEEDEVFYKNVFAEMQSQMPRLRIINTFRWTENDFLTDYETDDDDDTDIGY
ncbi:F-box/LRR-repeat protein fbxl-1-like [Schistocerca serialis cubense]|uniref:F-box/LRR-repeat protein fbxl-1-like n=1 Tax=Schistocerca serialis cubense TaxID=2023355 RepID=UPI00214DF3C0|nr:F-box/LRR-repeat protein fbxl-1-like [Schistocerca serialis cubense]